ncbi:hypothetical protein D934_11915 [Xylella fastidiosa subsp. sandyi Ann-1]|uniref:Uncharacterized protein n=1 Tax=Xylella fastidiosa subsp. sandyi Ann-1 TaxID=155920 RepID=A0A060HF79_XYLFS|nr:hypothetical protein D934_11915 [Xylella fastidiosa subsp. sandyi Ann-1]
MSIINEVCWGVHVIRQLHDVLLILFPFYLI